MAGGSSLVRVDNGCRFWVVLCIHRLMDGQLGESGRQTQSCCVRRTFARGLSYTHDDTNVAMALDWKNQPHLYADRFDVTRPYSSST